MAALFSVLFIVGMSCQLTLAARLQSDGFYYYAYLRSLAFDHDVDFTNDYKMLGLGTRPTCSIRRRPATRSRRGRSARRSCGHHFLPPRIPWRSTCRQRAPTSATDGMSYPVPAGRLRRRPGVWAARLLVHLSGLPLLLFTRWKAAAATAFTVCGSFMLWYLIKEPSMTHAPSMAGVAGFTWLWLATRARARGAVGRARCIAGFITLIRWQNALFAIMPAYEAIAALIAAGAQPIASALRADPGRAASRSLSARSIAFIPQMLAWRAIYGTYLAVSPVGPQIRWWDPHLVDVLWSSRNGLFSWSPVIYVAAIGLLIFARPVRRSACRCCSSVGAMIYFNASIQDWWGSSGFGGRRFDGTIPIFALGMAMFVDRGAAFARRFPFAVIGALGALLVVWNIALMRVAQEGHIRFGEAVRSASSEPTRSSPCTTGLAIPSPTPRALSSRRATICRSARMTWSKPTVFSATHPAPTAASTSAATAMR